ncbi:MAG: hypothetical protein F6K39_15475 [Okeania sp. SIO3B3]|nr:hypothetical protein [Okeania sp. SIO3B3]
MLLVDVGLRCRLTQPTDCQKIGCPWCFCPTIFHKVQIIFVNFVGWVEHRETQHYVSFSEVERSLTKYQSMFLVDVGLRSDA